VFTDRGFARRIVEHFAPVGKILDPARGDGAFYDHLPPGSCWCEVADGRDFLDWKQQVDWIITNPPWLAKAYIPFSQHAWAIADNVVFLVRLADVMGTSARINRWVNAGHGLKEIIVIRWRDTGFPKSRGWTLAFVHWCRGWREGTKWTWWHRDTMEVTDGPIGLRGIKFTRVFALANRNTFSIKPVAGLLAKYIKPTDRILEPFARDSRWGTVTNDSNKKTAAMFHMDALDFVRSEHARGPFDGVLIDPNYSYRQAIEIFGGHGKHTQDRGYLKKVYDRVAHEVRIGGIAISCGWDADGFGEGRGFVPIDGLIVYHGRPRHATIIVVERRFR
jgi:hypothetical protein